MPSIGHLNFISWHLLWFLGLFAGIYVNTFLHADWSDWPISAVGDGPI
jgi:hypothetical protein